MKNALEMCGFGPVAPWWLLELGDIITNNYLMVEKVTHNFKGDEHFMDLTLIGGEFIA